MWYHYITAVGTFWIRPQPNKPGSYWLGLDDMPLRAYPSPEAAAQAVQSQQTGLKLWDQHLQNQKPADISQWRQGKPDQAD